MTTNPATSGTSGSGNTSGAAAGSAAANTPTSSSTATSTTANAAATTSSSSSTVLTDQAVLEYLRRKGMGNAALKLQSILSGDSQPKNEGNKDSDDNIRAQLEEEDAVFRNQRTLVAKSTGGSYGSDRDSAWPVVQWGIPETPRQLPASGSKTTSVVSKLGVEEARAYLDAFTDVQLWVLGLPDHQYHPDDIGVERGPNPLEKARALIQSQKPVSEIMKELAAARQDDNPKRSSSRHTTYNLPPSAKPELLAVTFALLVHTYCELLEVGMESTAHCLRDAFEPIYTAGYEKEYRDLHHCVTTEDTIRLNSHYSQHMEALNALKAVLVQVASYQLRREEMQAQLKMQQNSSSSTQSRHQHEQKMKEYDKTISMLQVKYQELSQRASAAFDKMHDLPFLRRARAVRWQLTLSSTSYGLLMRFLQDDSRLPMSTLLQTKCEIHVERREPLPWSPSIVFEAEDHNKDMKEKISWKNLHDLEIAWAAPSRRSTAVPGEKLPFPRYTRDNDKEYDTEKDAEYETKLIEYNRKLLGNGFRRLEALERKRQYEEVESKAVAASTPASRAKSLCDPLQPTILLTSLASALQGPVLQPKASSSSPSTAQRDISSIWEEAGIGLCCAKQQRNMGTRVAVGCDDAAVRVFDLNQQETEAAQVLLGHKNGFPVFDVDWVSGASNVLLSAGGDGSIRMWDTSLTGPFGELPPDPKKPKTTSGATSSALDLVPGLRAETAPYQSGAALVVYRGHVPSTPVWSVCWSPAGYYFCSTGADATARLWVTDRTVPVRLLVGHTSQNVNTCAWHPNGNYVITGADDATCRLWDVHTGRTVRLLSGAKAGIGKVEISPCGRYAMGADDGGTITQWDLSNGRVLMERRPTPQRQKQQFHALAFSPCGAAFAAAGDDCCIRLWDVNKSEPVKMFPTNRTMVLDLSFTPRNLLQAAGKVITPVPLAKK